MSVSRSAGPEKSLCDFLLSETIVREDGSSAAIALGPSSGKTVLLTLGITRILEQQSIDLSVWGSADGSDWGTKPLAAFPQKFYCGTYTLSVDLSSRPEAAFLSVRWKLNRWGRSDQKPLFGLYVFVEEAALRGMALAK